MPNVSKHRALGFLTLSFLFFLALQVGYGQSTPDTNSTASLKKPLVRIFVESGNILKQQRPLLTSIDEHGNAFKTTTAISVEYGWQMLGGKAWHQTAKYPRMGLGAQYMHIMNRDEMGHPFSIYGFYDGNYLRLKNFEFTNRLAVGLAYGFTTYNAEDAMPNDIASTKFNLYVEMGAGFSKRLNDYLFIEPGLRLVHFSNGNTKEPQKGLNITSYKIGLRSVLGRPYTDPIKIPIEKCEHRHELIAFVGMAPRQLDYSDNNDLYHETYDMNFLMANLHLGYYYEVTHRMKLGGGLDFIYDGTNGQQELALTRIPTKDAIPFNDKIGLSIFVGGESVIDRFSIVAALGYMVAQTEFIGSSPAFEQRLGVKYHFYKNVFAGLNVRAYRFRAAEAMELNIGVRKFLK